MNVEERQPFDRTDVNFLEWLLSDHPAAVRERSQRRVEFTQWREGQRKEAWEFVRRIENDPGAADDLRGRAAAIRPIVARADLRAEVEDAFGDALQVLEDRRQWEIHLRFINGDPFYTYPCRYLGANAANCPPAL